MDRIEFVRDEVLDIAELGELAVAMRKASLPLAGMVRGALRHRIHTRNSASDARCNRHAALGRDFEGGGRRPSDRLEAGRHDCSDRTMSRIFSALGVFQKMTSASSVAAEENPILPIPSRPDSPVVVRLMLRMS